MRDDLPMGKRAIASLSVGVGLVGCAGPQTCPAVSCPSRSDSLKATKPSASVPLDSFGLTEEGRARLTFAFESSQGFSRAGSEALWFTIPPDATVLAVRYRPVCNELTMSDMSKFVDGLRARGFTRVLCYPETSYAFDIPPAGQPVHIEQPGVGDGWHCVIMSNALNAGMCVRDEGRCRQMAKATSGAEPNCTTQPTAYCSKNKGEEMCFTTAEACVHLNEQGSTPCEAMR